MQVGSCDVNKWQSQPLKIEDIYSRFSNILMLIDDRLNRGPFVGCSAGAHSADVTKDSHATSDFL